MAGPNPPITSILPDAGWAPLLEIIVQDAPAGAGIEVNTPGMQALAEQQLAAVGRPRALLPAIPEQGILVVIGGRW